MLGLFWNGIEGIQNELEGDPCGVLLLFDFWGGGGGGGVDGAREGGGVGD